MFGFVFGALACFAPQRSVDGLKVGIAAVRRWHHFLDGLEANYGLFLGGVRHAHDQRPIQAIEPATVDITVCLVFLNIPGMIEAAPAHVLRAVALAKIGADEAREIFDEHVSSSSSKST